MRGQSLDNLLRCASDGDTVAGKTAQGEIKADVRTDPRGKAAIPVAGAQQEGFGPWFPRRGKVEQGAILVEQQTLNVF